MKKIGLDENFYFQEGKLFINNIYCLLAPIHTSIVMYDYLSKNHPIILKKQLIRLKEISYALSEHIKTNHRTKLDKNNILENLKILNSLGIGKIELIRNNNGSIYLFKCQNPIFSILSENILNNKNYENNCFDFFTEYFLLGMLESITQKKVISKSFKKINTNYFEYKILKNKNNSQIKNNFNFEKRNLKNKLNPIIERVILNEHLKNKNGILHIWGMNVIAIPIEIFKIEDFKKNNEIKSYFKIIGETQGKAAYQIIANLFGSQKENLKTFQNICYQTELIGVGKTELLIFDEKKKIIKVKFYQDLIFEDGILTIIGYYLIGIFHEVLNNIFDEELTYELENDNQVTFKSENKKYFFSKEKEKLSEYMGINAITKSSVK